MSGDSPLDRIIYISIPEEAHRTIGDFTIDADKLIPVEIPPDKESVDLTELSWEMIISAMLKIFAYNPAHRDIEYYRSFIHAVQPNLPAELSQAGIIKAEAKEYDLAQEIFTALRYLVPEDEKAFLNLAFLYEDMMENAASRGLSDLHDAMQQQAHIVYRDMLQLHSGSPEAVYHAASFMIKSGSPARARELYEQFLDLAPEDERAAEVSSIIGRISRQDSQDILFAEAFDLIQLGKEEEALEKIGRYLTDNPKVWNAWFVKGWALRRLERYSEAEQAFLQSASMEDGEADVFNELAICQMELGKLEASRQSLARALKLEPENVKIIANLGILALKMHNEEEAIAFFRAAREIDPEDPVAAHYLDIFDIGGDS